MKVRGLFIAGLMAVTICAVSGQTFQYSRGWTNGKRSDGAAAINGIPLEFKLPVGGALQQIGDGRTVNFHCPGLQKLRMLLLDNANDEICHLPCEFLNIIRRCLIHDSTFSEVNGSNIY